ncbi:AbiTii domain-containing protein [Legionella taurinensis]|nr:hypothetical protein [Legionella taurinensis]MDX1838868.1 hypothetical protein [Legionella taurinensis]
MSENIPASKKALLEALELSNEILRNIELSELPLENVALKTGRLARLLNDFKMHKIMQFEVSGYPSSVNGLPTEIYGLAVEAGRESEVEETIDKKKVVKKYVYAGAIRDLEEGVRVKELSLTSSQDPHVSISSANPQQYVMPVTSNKLERSQLLTAISKDNSRLASRRSFIYHYVLSKNLEIKFSGIPDDFFVRVRNKVDEKIGEILPESIMKFNAVYENLLSENTEDWSNAVHSCRRILQDLADKVCPSTKESKMVDGKEIKLGKDNYTNRIMNFVSEKSESERFEDIVGSHLKYLGERLDSIFKAAQKGSHDKIVTREEADRYVTFTYLVVGDVLSLFT